MRKSLALFLSGVALVIAASSAVTLCPSARAATMKHSRPHQHVTASVGANTVGVGHTGDGVRVGGPAMGGIKRFNASYISLDHGVDDYTMQRSGYTLYGYNPDCNDFFFRHPDYHWQCN
jgi:hypothetical protein